MAPQLPQRPDSHRLETESNHFFRHHLPQAWTCDEPQNDYGVDFRIGIAESDYLTGQAFVVQLKASAKESAGETVVVQLSIATLNYLRNLLEVAMIVKYVADEKEAYWILLKDVAKPSDDQKTITIRIPRENRLSNRPWTKIAEYVALVHFKKLGAMHATNGPKL